MKKTTPRDNLLRTLRRQGYDWAPLDPARFCPAQLEAFEKRFGHQDYMAWFKAPHRHCGVKQQPMWRDAASLYPREQLPPDTQIDAWGIAHSRQPGCFHMTHMHHPLQGDATAEEVRNYPLPRPAPDAGQLLRAQVDELHARGLAAMAGMSCTLWEIGWYIRSMEDLMADMMSDDERAAIHFERLTANAIERIRICAASGIDVVQLGDDIGMQSSIMMSLDLWRKWLKPRLARIIAAGREIKPDLLIFYHSCGYIIPFIPELIEAGVDILNPVQPECMDFDEVHRLANGKLSFWSTIGTQKTLPFGTPAEVKNEVRARLNTCGKAGGIVVGPTHMVEPEVPWANLAAMAEAVDEFNRHSES